MRYSWPGNVRELENACERIAQTCTCGTVRVGCMTAHILFRAGAQPQDGASPAPALPTQAAPVALDDRLRELETNLITWALRVSHGNRAAAELRKIKRSTLASHRSVRTYDRRSARACAGGDRGERMSVASP
jgi:DNA-binding NtrC family response regulator